MNPTSLSSRPHIVVSRELTQKQILGCLRSDSNCSCFRISAYHALQKQYSLFSLEIHMDNGGAPSSGVTERIKTVFEMSELGEPYTSRELADELEAPRTTVYSELQELVTAGDLNTKKVGIEERVWWESPEAEPKTPPPSPTDAEETRLYEKLADSERQFRAVFEEAFDAILIADEEAKYVEANPAACDLFGLPKEELIGRTISEFAAEGYDFEEAWKDFQESDLDRGLFPLIRADGEQRIVEFAATPNILPGRHLSVLRDVTERREVKTKLKQEQERSKQYQKTLAADTVIELEFQMNDSNVFGELSDQLDCSCEFEGMVVASDGRYLHYVMVVGAVADDILSVVVAYPEVNDCRIVFESESAVLLELDMNHSPHQTLVEAGANGRSIRSEKGVTTVIAEVGAEVDLQKLINAFKLEYPAATVVAKRTLNRPIMTTRQYRDSLASEFTERQTETLRAAYLAGYFEWPRQSQAEQIATSMGIATSTWLRHLRLGESKLVRWFFEELEA